MVNSRETWFSNEMDTKKGETEKMKQKMRFLYSQERNPLCYFGRHDHLQKTSNFLFFHTAL